MQQSMVFFLLQSIEQILAWIYKCTTNWAERCRQPVRSEKRSSSVGTFHKWMHLLSGSFAGSQDGNFRSHISRIMKHYLPCCQHGSHKTACKLSLGVYRGMTWELVFSPVLHAHPISTIPFDFYLPESISTSTQHFLVLCKNLLIADPSSNFSWYSTILLTTSELKPLSNWLHWIFLYH